MSPRRTLAFRVFVLAALGLAAAAAPAGAATATIGGTVTNAAHEPLAGICVSAYPPSGSDPIAPVPTKSTTTSASGAWALNLEAGLVKIGFSDCANHVYASQFARGHADLASAEIIPVLSPSPAVDATLAPGAAVSGAVYAGDGTDAPIAGACVALLTGGGVVAAGTTGEDGSYLIAGVPAGDYTVKFLTVKENCPLVPATQHFAAASVGPVTLEAGAETTGVDAHLVSDEVAPVVRLLGGPSGATGDNSVAFAFVADDLGAGFTCTLDGATAPCTSPKSYLPVNPGAHDFSVLAVDSAGNASDPVTRSWTIVPGQPARTQGAAPAGGTVTSDVAGAGTSGVQPVVVAVTTPDAGDVTIALGTNLTTPVGSTWKLFGRQVDVIAPDASAGAPLKLVFTIDGTAMPENSAPDFVTVFRDGVAVSPCSGAPGTASPDPCLAQAVPRGGGKAELTVLSSHASTWNFATVKSADPPDNGGTGGGTGGGGTGGGTGGGGGIPTPPAGGGTLGGGVTTNPLASLVNGVFGGSFSGDVTGGVVAPGAVAGVTTGADASQRTGTSTTAKPCTPPKLKNHTLKGAKLWAKLSGCTIGTVTRKFKARAKKGRVISQSARPGRISPPGRRINIVLAL